MSGLLKTCSIDRRFCVRFLSPIVSHGRLRPFPAEPVVGPWFTTGHLIASKMFFRFPLAIRR